MESAPFTHSLVFKKFHSFTALTLSISDTYQLLRKYHTDTLSMKYSTFKVMKYYKLQKYDFQYTFKIYNYTYIYALDALHHL